MTGGLGQFADLMGEGGLAKKGGGVFERGGGLIPQCTLWRIRKCNQLNQFRWTSTKIISIEKTSRADPFIFSSIAPMLVSRSNKTSPLRYYPFMHNVEKWPSILLNFCGVHTAKFLKYVWPIFNILHERVKMSLLLDVLRHSLIFREKSELLVAKI